PRHLFELLRRRTDGHCSHQRGVVATDGATDLQNHRLSSLDSLRTPSTVPDRRFVAGTDKCREGYVLAACTIERTVDLGGNHIVHDASVDRVNPSPHGTLRRLSRHAHVCALRSRLHEPTPLHRATRITKSCAAHPRGQD